MVNRVLLVVLLSVNVAYGNKQLLEDTTSFGNTISYLDSYYSINLKDGQQLDFLKKWYFYKNNIIGELEYSYTNAGNYFVLNEEKNLIIKFNSKIEWNKYIESENLKPFIYTRWFNGFPNDFFDDSFFLMSIYLFFLSIPLSLGFFYLVYKSILYEKLNI